LALLAAMLAFSLSAGNAVAQKAALMDGTITFFYYEDLEAQLPFYEGLLELEKTMDEGWVKIYRITPTSSVGLVEQGHGFHDVSDDKPAMLSMVTGDVDAWYERLVAAKVRILKELPPPGSDSDPDRAPVRGFIVEDPGGYTIEFFSWQKSQ
jgi:catechol 2,3-dioxygenase-like lactoylglutathione lyase family enzyme